MVKVKNKVVVGIPLTKIDSKTFDDVTLCRSTIGALQHATLTRLEIVFLVNKLSQFLAGNHQSLAGM